jgi:hypothetical protein
MQSVYISVTEKAEQFLIKIVTVAYLLYIIYIMIKRKNKLLETL